MRVRIARDELRRIGELSRTIKALEAEIAGLVATIAPQQVSEPGFGPLTAAKLVAEIAGAQRFATPAKLARAAGVAPLPASSGNTQRQRLDQGGNRQINAALHRAIVTHARCHQPTRDYIARRRREGKSTRERRAGGRPVLERRDADPGGDLEGVDRDAGRDRGPERRLGDGPVREEQVDRALAHDPRATGQREWAVIRVRERRALPAHGGERLGGSAHWRSRWGH